MKLKVYWENSYPENAQSDWELYNTACWTDMLEVQEVDNRKIRKVFDEQDGDCDFTHTILMVTDDKNEILWRGHKQTDEEYDYKLEQFLSYAEKIDTWNQIEVRNGFFR